MSTSLRGFNISGRWIDISFPFSHLKLDTFRTKNRFDLTQYRNSVVKKYCVPIKFNTSVILTVFVSIGNFYVKSQAASF